MRKSRKAVAKVTTPQWSLSAYIAADNNLDFGGKQLVAELRSAGATDNVRIFAQLDPQQTGKSSSFMVFGPVGRMAAEDIGETDTGKAETLSAFLQRAFDQVKVSKRFALLWSHGGAIDPDQGGYPAAFVPGILFAKTRDSVRRHYWICPDSSSADFLDNIELQKAFNDVRQRSGSPYDVIAFEACSMNALEVAYQLRAETSYIIGSQTSILDGTWPHDTIMHQLQTNAKMDAVKLGQVIVEAFATTKYTDEPGAISLLDQSEIGELTAAFNELALHLIAALADDAKFRAIKVARRATLSFDKSGTIDIVDFCLKLRDLVNDPTLNPLCENVETAVSKYVLHRRGTTMSTKRACGVSIYFPLQKISSSYLLLDFTRDHQWLLFLLQFLAKDQAVPVTYLTTVR